MSGRGRSAPVAGSGVRVGPVVDVGIDIVGLAERLVRPLPDLLRRGLLLRTLLRKALGVHLSLLRLGLRALSLRLHAHRLRLTLARCEVVLLGLLPDLAGLLAARLDLA